MSRIKRSKELKPRETKSFLPILVGKTPAQDIYIEAMKKNTITLVHGYPGTGKTYLATLFGLNEFLRGKYRKMIFTRPYVEACGEKIGFLPGSSAEKLLPMIMPIMDILEENMSREQIDHLMKSREIMMLPMGYLRGLTFKSSFVILDESQSTTPEQMHLFLTRIGEGSKIVVTGDLRQSDIRGINGMADAVKRLEGIDGIGMVELDKSSIVRHPLIAEIETRYGN